MAPFVQSFAPFKGGTQASRSHSALSPLLNLNAWSAFLVLATLQVQIFNFSQERLFSGSLIIQDDSIEMDMDSVGYDHDTAVNDDLQQWQNVRRGILLGMTSVFSLFYPASSDSP
jgi:hypothetical protein